MATASEKNGSPSLLVRPPRRRLPGGRRVLPSAAGPLPAASSVRWIRVEIEVRSGGAEALCNRGAKGLPSLSP
ncbi:hypothetical protein ZWY2020_038187 [Hordeum vulgare]|nr:hypothetical protein ZWY2020_038187 [Hordeum vulgare]